MDKRIRLTKYRRINNFQKFAVKFKNDIFVNFIRIILSHDCEFTIGINNLRVYSLFDDLSKKIITVKPYYDDIEKYYYYDLKFIEFQYIFNFIVSTKFINDPSLIVFIEIDYDSDFDIFYDQSNDLINEESLDDYKNNIDGSWSYIDKVYVKLINKENYLADVSSDEIKTIQDNYEFDIKKIKNNIYKITFEDIGYVPNNDNTNQEDDNPYELIDITFYSKNISYIASNFPLINFPDINKL